MRPAPIHLALWNRGHRARLTLGIELLLMPLQIFLGRHVAGPDFLDLLDEIGLALWRPERPGRVTVVPLRESVVQRRQNLGLPGIDTTQILAREIDRRRDDPALTQCGGLRLG